MRRALLLAVCVLALAAGPAALAGSGLVVGAADDIVLSADPTAAANELGLLTNAGMTAARIAIPWQPGQSGPDPATLSALTTTAQQAALAGVRLYVEVYPASPDAVPADDSSRAVFAQFMLQLALALPTVHDYVVGSQPNNPAFWPQGPEAAAGYVALLAASYDALKAVSPSIQVIGGSLDAQDWPGSYVLAMGKAYKKSGRASPLMDAFALQPAGTSSAEPPGVVHPTGLMGIGDYGRLVANLKRAFGGTAQPAASLPIVYDGYAVQTQPPPEKASLYTGSETDAVPEAVQGSSYAQALQLASCQANVAALLFQKAVDDADLGGWQSGLYYPDGTPKSDFGTVSAAIAGAKAGTLGGCPQSPAPAAKPGEAAPPTLAFDGSGVTVSCSSACYYVAVLRRAGGGVPLQAKQGAVAGGATTSVSFTPKGAAAGGYEVYVHAADRQAPEQAVEQTGPSFGAGG